MVYASQGATPFTEGVLFCFANNLQWRPWAVSIRESSATMKRDRMQPRNRSKGTVRIEMRAGRQIVIKDYRGIKNPLVRLYGNMTLRNEPARIPAWQACQAYRYATA